MDLEELLTALASDDDLRAKFTAASSSDERAQVLREAGFPFPDGVELETIHARLSSAGGVVGSSTTDYVLPRQASSSSATGLPQAPNV